MRADRPVFEIPALHPGNLADLGARSADVVDLRSALDHRAVAHL